MPIKEIDVNDEYAKDKDIQKEDIEALKQWIAKQAHLPKLSDFHLLLFLHSCYNKIEPTKATIEAFFIIKADFAEVFEKRDPNSESLLQGMECGLYGRLPQSTPEGYRVLLFKFMDTNPSKFVVTDQMKLFDMSMRLWYEEHGTAEGFFFVIDVKEFGFGHLARIGVMNMKNFFTYLQEGIPVRLKGLFFVNAGVAAEKMLAMSKPFIKAEMFEKLHMHAEVSPVFKFVPQECFPKEYGGNADSVNDLHDEMKAKLLDNAEYFNKEEQIKGDESKRIERRPNINTVDYGVEGSFKKIELD